MRERAQERNGGIERWLWLKRRVLFVFILPSLWLPSSAVAWCGRHSAIAPPRGGGEASPNEQKEAGLEQGETEHESGLAPLTPGGGEALGWPTTPMPALLARGSKVGRFRKRDWRSPAPGHPAPPRNIWPLPSRAEMGIWPPLAARAVKRWKKRGKERNKESKLGRVRHTRLHLVY